MWGSWPKFLIELFSVDLDSYHRSLALGKALPVDLTWHLIYIFLLNYFIRYPDYKNLTSFQYHIIADTVGPSMSLCHCHFERLLLNHSDAGILGLWRRRIQSRATWPLEEKNSIWGQRRDLITQNFCVIKFY